MMLKMGEVDGLVSGAIHSTADTLRPALQVIKCAPGVKSVSSVFFMCMPGKTYIYGDCAINLNPTGLPFNLYELRIFPSNKSSV